MQLPKRKAGKYTDDDNDPHMSQQKYDALEKKLQKLIAQKPTLADEVSRLAELGDFSENVEYQAAKQKLRTTLNMITKINAQLNHAIIINNTTHNIIHIGSTVYFLLDSEEKIYTILGSSEANPDKHIISHSSPLGIALLGHKCADVFDIQLGDKIRRIEIQHIA